MRLKNFRWWHWLFLGACSAYLAWTGLALVIQGAAPSSRFYVVDNIAIRLIGIGMLFFAIAPFSGRKWAFHGAIALLVLKTIESVTTFDPSAAFPDQRPLLAYIAFSITLTVMYLPPLLILLWLNKVIGAEATQPSAPATAPNVGRPQPDIGRSGKRAAGTFLLLLTLGGLFSPFILGFLSIPQGYMMLLAPVFLLAPVLSCLGVALILTGTPKPTRISLSIVALLAPFGFLMVFPGAALWTLGFAANFRLTKHPAEIQTWAIEQLHAYHQGTLSINTNAEYWAAGREKIDESSLPQHIRTLWTAKPSIGIATMTRDGWLIDPERERNASIDYEGTTNCVAISWYLHGFLLGTPDFKPTWNPWYMHRMSPGIYAFCGMK